MLTPDQLKGAIYAMALAHGYTELTAVTKQIEQNGADLVEQECFVSLNEVESDILPRNMIAGDFKNTNKVFFMSQALSFKCWHYSPLNDGLSPYDRDTLINEIVEKSVFPALPNKK